MRQRSAVTKHSRTNTVGLVSSHKDARFSGAVSVQSAENTKKKKKTRFNVFSATQVTRWAHTKSTLPALHNKRPIKHAAGINSLDARDKIFGLFAASMGHSRGLWRPQSLGGLSFQHEMCHLESLQSGLFLLQGLLLLLLVHAAEGHAGGGQR